MTSTLMLGLYEWILWWGFIYAMAFNWWVNLALWLMEFSQYKI